jgi:ligand-binding sensor domain-containing protein
MNGNTILCNNIRSRRVPTQCVLSCGFYPLLFLLIFTTSCTGQVNAELSEDRGNKVVTFSSGQTISTDQSDTLPYCPLDIVQCAYQDKAGNLWFGTGEGVFRYDGKTFTHFTVKDGLCHNEVGAIGEDKSGNLWFGGRYGRLFRYEGKSFTDFSSDVHPQ